MTLSPPLRDPIMAALCLLIVSTTTHAETISLPNGTSVEVPDGIPAEARQQLMKSAMNGRKPSEGKQGKDEKKVDDKKKEGDKGKDEKKGGDKKKTADTVPRPTKPKKEPNTAELEAMPQNGKITLQFEGHPWPAMIEWYSRASGRAIEWQDLPSGFINLRTQRPFTMKETGDLLNRLLLTRGFTIVDDGDFMQVIKTEGMNPAFVPRVAPQQLATLGPHSFVRVSFQLKRFKADELAKELAAMKSKHGTLVPMTAANRIEAMDTVRNLRDIYAAIDAEQNSGAHAPREFEIQYLRAANVKKKLDEMFQAKSGPAMTPQQIKQMQEQQQRNRGNNNGKQPPQPGGKADAKISIIVNELRNSIIVKAAPHIMVDVAAAVELLDVELTRDTLDIKAYTLATRSPQELSEILNESGALSPNAIVRVDKNSKALLVSGNQFDHFKIDELIKKIDGNPRRFESIRLRRYPALQVATTIENMMGKPKEEGNKRRNRYYSYWDNNDEEEENPNDVFRVTADVENNRLILKCNDTEYEMVIELLTQMGEVMTRSKYAANEVVIDGIDSEDALLKRVRELFNATSDNEVILPPPVVKPLEVDDDDAAAEDDETDVEIDNPNEVKATEPEAGTKPVVKHSPYRTLLTQTEAATLENAQPVRRNQRRPKAPPVIISRNAQGKLVIRCDDPAALEKFEEILRQVAPPTQDWVHFKLKHVTAFWMKLQLKDFFEEDEDDNQGFFVWWGGGNDEDTAPPGLGDEKKMRFIDDGESILVVRNASAKQLATVRELIDLYDVVEPANELNARFKQIIQIKHSKARVIESTLKDAFRDLLSSNDKAFAQQKSGDEGEGRGRRSGPFNFSESTTSALQGTTFKGKISFGVDESTNRLIVTAEGKKLLNLIVDMVTELDVAAVAKDDTRVITVPAGLNTQTLRETLTRMFGADSITVKPQEGEENGEKPNPENGQRERRGRGNQNR